MSASNAQNRGAFMTAPATNIHEVRDASFPTPKPDELVIKVHAAAVNPADYGIATKGIIIDHASYPVIAGCDFTGEVVGMGNEAAHIFGDKGNVFKVGDRILGACNLPGVEGQGAYQLYTVANARLCAILPDGIAYEDGCVLPLGFSTAAAGLCSDEGMKMPTPGSEQQYAWKDKRILVWGAGSSVGSCAVQLCKAAGLKVAVTASAKNEEYCQQLGADMFFDYKSESVNKDIATALKPMAGDSVGIFAAVGNPFIPGEAQVLVDCGAIVKEIGGPKVVGTIIPPLPGFEFPKECPEDVKYCFNFGAHTLKQDEVGATLFGHWLTTALGSGEMKCLPEKEVVGKGLEHVQTALDRFGKGVSARKIVVQF